MDDLEYYLEKIKNLIDKAKESLDPDESDKLLNDIIDHCCIYDLSDYDDPD